MSRIIIHNNVNRHMEKTITLKPLTNEALAELFLSMALKEDNRKDAEKAFCEFYTRYKNYLFTIVKNACEPWEMYGDELIEYVYDNTFLKVFEKAESFLIIEDIPFERQENRMKSWLGKIAQTEMFILLRQFKDEKEKIDYHDDMTFLEEPEEEIIQQKTEDFLLAEKALRSLSERDRHILVTYLMFEDGNKKLPSNEVQRLGETWDILPDNMRQIKKRSLEKVKIYIETYKRK